ncbi:MAG: ABC transporter permease subunit [Candidatus Bathyarchaeota archaeon]|nr:iron ABC transporter permease [Candidatus Bathyarchaeota archaeon A05DMB-3]MDH7606779.1 ABC transporter permease subunit [Candidatus Bathyarchaeota archaeon]
MPKKFAEKLDKLSSKPLVKYGVYLTAVILFFALILLPPILGIIIKWDAMQDVLGNGELIARALNAVKNSFTIAVLVSVLDVVAGIPMAWLVTRGKSRWLNVLDTLADVPFIVPTAVLGYSILLFWSDSEKGISAFFGSSLISPGWLLVALLHFTFSYPVVVRVIVGALLDYKIEYEQASRTLGAPPLTTARTVTLGIIKPSLIAAFILAFARSISETGATMMVAGAFENGPVFIQNMKNAFSVQPPLVSQAVYEGSTVFASLILIAVSCLIFAVVRIFATRFKLPIKGAWPSLERKLSYSSATLTRNSVALLVFFAIVLIPSLFVALPAFEALSTNILPNALAGVSPWDEYWQSLILSYSLGAIVTVLNVLVGLPMAIVVARKRLGTSFSSALNVLVDIPIIVPSVALGASLRFFWKETLAFIPDVWLLVFAHLAITYPYFVRSMSAAVERIGIELEEASRTLGAKPLTVFRTIILPLTKYSMFSGAVMVFTRSVSETGATLAVTSLKTAPVVLVDWVKGKIDVSPLEIGLGCGFLILFSFIILLALRLIIKGKGRY